MGIRTKIKLLSSVILMGVGGSLMVYGVNNGASTSVNWDSVKHSFVISRGEKELYEQAKTEIDSFKEIDLDLKTATVNLIPSDDYYIEYHVSTTGNFSYKVDDGKLIVSDDNGKFFNLNFGSLGDLFSEDNENSYVNIYYPEDTHIGDFNASLDMGSLNMDGLGIKEADIDLDMGSLYMDNCIIEDCQIDLDMGSLHMNDTVVDYLEADLDMGTVNGMGVGVTDKMDLDLDMGSANLDMITSYDSKGLEYGYDFSCDMGSITIDGENYGHEKEKNGKKMIKISCDMGNITFNQKK